MRVVVFGSGGFIGSHVVSHLAAGGADVLSADIVDTGQPNFVMVEDRGANFVELLGAAAPDVIVNCAGAASVPQSIENPRRDFDLNVALAAAILDAIRKAAPGARFVNMSSAAVYGEPAKSPIAETAPVQPVSPYGWHKAQAEVLCREYATLFGLKCLSLRVFSAYGPGLKKQLFWDFFQKGRRSDIISMFGTGNETRDFIYVADIASALATVIDRADFDGGVVNVASGRSVSVRDAVGALADALGWRKEVRFSGETRAGDPVAWQADISVLQALGFAPEFDLNRGLGKVGLWLNDV